MTSGGPDARAAVAGALASVGRTGAVEATRDLSGGCIHHVTHVRLADGSTVVAKLARPDRAALFAEEAHGLETLAATETVVVPAPIVTGVFAGRAVLVMTAIDPAPAHDDGWRALGAALAALHAAGAGDRYGFEVDNHLGTTRQPNAWADDWVDFNARHRLGWQVGLAESAGRLTPEEIGRFTRLIDDLDRFIPRRPKPALLHGDLWSGNALPTRRPDGAPAVAVIDPACSVGDGWADIAMMRLFGGFPAVCHEAYARAADDHDRVEERIAVYQLYHVLNHVNLFGRGYVGQALGLAGRLGF